MSRLTEILTSTRLHPNRDGIQSQKVPDIYRTKVVGPEAEVENRTSQILQPD